MHASLCCLKQGRTWVQFEIWNSVVPKQLLSYASHFYVIFSSMHSTTSLQMHLKTVHPFMGKVWQECSPDFMSGSIKVIAYIGPYTKVVGCTVRYYLMVNITWECSLFEEMWYYTVGAKAKFLFLICTASVWHLCYCHIMKWKNRCIATFWNPV